MLQLTRPLLWALLAFHTRLTEEDESSLQTLGQMARLSHYNPPALQAIMNKCLSERSSCAARIESIPSKPRLGDAAILPVHTKFFLYITPLTMDAGMMHHYEIQHNVKYKGKTYSQRESMLCTYTLYELCIVSPL